MADINAYALGIEFTLQTEANKILSEVSNQISDIELKVKNLMVNMSKSMDMVGSGVASVSKNMIKSLQGVNQTVKSFDFKTLADKLSDPIDKITTATSSLSDEANAFDKPISNMSESFDKVASTISKVNSSSSDLSVKLDDIGILIHKISDANLLASESDYAKEAIEQYQYLTNTVLTGLMQQKIDLAEKGNSLGKEELLLIDYIEKLRLQMSKTGIKAESEYYKISEKWMETSKKFNKKQFLSKKEILSLTKEELDIYREYIKAIKTRSKVESLTTTGTVKGAAERSLANATETQNTIGGITKTKKTIDVLQGAYKKLSEIMGKTFRTMGMGEVADAASLSGMYTAGVMKAAEEEERFHTINYRTIGSIEDMQKTIQDLSLQYPLLRKEIAESTSALREVGGTKKDIEILAPSIAAINRTTGASAESASKFSKAIIASTASVTNANKGLARMQRMAKEAGLTGRDLDYVMQAAADSAFIMGSKGTSYAEKFQVMLLQASGAAKELGLSAQDAVDVVDKMKDPLNTVKILGRQAFNMDPEQRMVEVGRRAEMFYKKFTQMEEGMAKFKIGREIMARFDIHSYGQIEKQLKLYMQTAKGGKEALKDGLIDPQKEFADALREASALLRDTKVSVEKTISTIMNALKPLKDFMSWIFDWFSNSSIGPTILAWGTAAAAAAGGFMVFKVAAGLGLKALRFLVGTGPAAAKGMAAQGAAAAQSAAKVGIFTKVIKGALPWLGRFGKLLLSPWIAVPLLIYQGAKDIWRVSKAVQETAAAWKNSKTEIENTRKALTHAKAAAKAAGIQVQYTAEMKAIDEQIQRLKKLNDVEKDRAKQATRGLLIAELLEQLNEVGTKALKDQSGEITKNIKKNEMMEKIFAESKKLEQIKDTAKAMKEGAKKNLTDQKAIDSVIESQNKKIKQQEELVNRLNNQLKTGQYEEAKKAKTLEISRDEASKYLKLLESGATAGKYFEAQEEIAEKLGVSAFKVRRMLLERVADKEKEATKAAKGKETAKADKEKEATKVFDIKIPEMDPKLKAAVDGLNGTEVAAKTKEEPRAEVIPTSKISSATARPVGNNREMEEFIRQNSILTSVSGKLDKKFGIDELMSLLKDYLPRMADKDTGLASSASQWVT